MKNTSETKQTRTVILPRPDLVLNVMQDTDSYKLSHYVQYPEKMTMMASYFESRGGEFDECTLFGLQVFLHKFLSKPITQVQIDQMAEFAPKHGEPFNRKGWEHILKVYGGKLPVKIRAIPEGTILPTRNALLTIECNDPECFWVVNWLETLLSRLWYPSTIAITSREQKKVWKQYLDLSSENPEAEIMFKLHSFAGRGVCTQEQAEMGDAAHLLNFLGTDTIAGIFLADHYYDAGVCGGSIRASEHSTMTVWGRDHEYDALKNWVQKTLVDVPTTPGIPKLSACVGDSYDLFNFARMVCSPEISSMIKSSGGTLVLRPDSGDPIEILGKLLDLLGELLGDEITTNSKGYKMLPPWLRLIQGDGVNRYSMKNILHHVVVAKGWSASILAMGSGGGLLQDVNRDTQKFAFKCCFAEIDGKAVDVRKDPLTDESKRSKAGRLDVIKNENGSYETVYLLPDQESHPNSIMNVVFENGDILYHTTFDECRERMKL